MICRNGHEFHEKIACPTCAKDASARMLVEFLERAIRNRQRTYRTLDHVTLNADYWRRVLREQGVDLNEIEVPMLCGAVTPLAEVSKAVQRIVKHSAEEDASGKCYKCEARLAALAGHAPPFQRSIQACARKQR